MTRQDALALTPPAGFSGTLRIATGTDGTDWYWTWQEPDRDWTAKAVWIGDCGGVRQEPCELDPPGVDWTPGLVNIPSPPLPPREPAREPGPCRCAACRKRRANP